MKIVLQIALIAPYLSGFLFNVHSTFKGRIHPFLEMISDEYFLNLIIIESTIQGNHEELEIFLQKCLISSCFKRKLCLKNRVLEN